MTHLRTTGTIALIAALAVACGGDDDGGATGPETPVVTSLEISPGAATLTAVGDSRRLIATVRDQNGEPMAGASVSWSALDDAVATVDGSGGVTAVSGGEARIEAASGDAADTAVITVAPEAATVVIEPPFGELNAAGDTIRLEAAVLDRNGNTVEGATVEWSSLDSDVATVDDAGRVVAVADGTARIRAAAGELEDEAAVVVDRIPATIELTAPDDTLAEGESVQLEAAVEDANGFAMPSTIVSWSTSDSTAASVDAGGRVTAVWGAATATVTAAAGDASAQAEIHVLGKIAFQSSRTGGGDIYLMNTDGSGLHRLTSNDTIDNRPVWSPDGGRIAFESLRDGDWEIYAMTADGALIENLTDAPGDTIDVNPAWSPDGSKIAFTSRRDGNFDIYVMNADGVGVERLTTDAAADEHPTWSPDGTQIAFVSDRDGNQDIYIMNADGTGSPIQVTTTSSPIDNMEPAWSPDGERIAFARTDGVDVGIATVRVDGSDEEDLTPDTDSDIGPRWSPDGSRILFTSLRDGNAEIYVMNADGSGQTRLTDHAGTDVRADWRPR
ncbi:MAG: Ig-like domain-containing protein, partial [Gemmatimonadota bacterium]